MFCLQIIYTVSKSDFSMFLTWSDLGSDKHVTEAEVADAYRVCTEAIKTYSADLSSIAVDNAARLVAAQVADKFPGNSVTVSRDPAHCVDLLSKDLAKTKAVTRVIDDAKEIRDFVKTDRIDSMRLESHDEGDLEETCALATMVDTRM